MLKLAFIESYSDWINIVWFLEVHYVLQFAAICVYRIFYKLKLGSSEAFSLKFWSNVLWINQCVSFRLDLQFCLLNSVLEVDKKGQQS